MNRLEKIIIARVHGIKHPYATMKVAEQTGVPFYILCAFLEKESGGGNNVFGHDNSIFRGAGTVTKEKYLAYKKLRDLNPHHRRMQGVGPMQLTYWSYQDEADAVGGCWKPWANTLVGARILARHYPDGIRIRGNENDAYRYCAYKYNGGQRYVDETQRNFDKWRELVDDTPVVVEPEPVPVVPDEEKKKKDKKEKHPKKPKG